MKLIEIHVLQSFPVSCLNRDDIGAPKSAVFGGANRARISSQCLKRAIRELAADLRPEFYAGHRSRLIIQPLADRLIKLGVENAKAIEAAKKVGDHLATLDKEAAKKGELKVKTLIFLSPSEMDAMAQRIASVLPKKPSDKEFEKAISQACKDGERKDAADIAIFGRMVASDQSLTLEGAGLFGHALSTHKAENEIDFFSAVDDLQKADQSGAGMTGTLEFTSASYYRYAGLNLDLLWDEDHLEALNPEERKQVIDAFLRAVIMAVPGARKNAMNSNTLPGFVLGLVKDKGQPLQLINAFEQPVRSSSGLLEPSRQTLLAHHQSLKKTWNIQPALELSIPEVDLNTFCAEVLKHV